MKRLVYSLILISLALVSQAQKKLHLPDKNQFSSFYYRSNESINQVEFKISIVAQFTSGLNIQQKIKLGFGTTISYSHRNWKIDTGIDITNKKNRTFQPDVFHIGTGIDNIKDEKHALFFLNRYFGEYAQWSGLLSLQYEDFQIRFEDDIFGLIATKFKLFDRYRSAALEIRYRYFILGANVFTSDINGLVDMAKNNKLGTYYNGIQYDSPIYIGAKYRDIYSRVGWNNKFIGEGFQNFTHQKLFNTPNFKTQNYNSLFWQGGFVKDYTLY